MIRAGASLIHTSFPLLTWDGEFGLENNGTTSLAAVPTAAPPFQCSGLAGRPVPHKQWGTNWPQRRELYLLRCAGGSIRPNKSGLRGSI